MINGKLKFRLKHIKISRCLYQISQAEISLIELRKEIDGDVVESAICASIIELVRVSSRILLDMVDRHYSRRFE